MSNLTIIVSIGQDYAIGREGGLAFYISDDLRHFKALTMGHPIIMGRRTFESLPKGALPGRRNIVITRNAEFAAANVETAPSLEAAIAMTADAEQAFILGGGSVYAQAMPIANTLEITHIEATDPQADTHFPAIDPQQWELVSETAPTADSRSGLTYRFATYRRR